MQTKIDYDIAILCGGLSSRFKKDKTLAQVNEKSMIQCTIDSVQPLQKRIFLVCKETHHDKYKDLNLDFSFDTERDFASIYGLKAALEGSTKQHVLVLAADLPLFELEVVLHLLKNHTGKSTIAYYDGLQPLSSIYDIDILEQLNEYISHGTLAIQKFVKSIDHSLVHFDHLKNNPFQNINTQQDLSNLIPK
ncbi:MAG: molybdenum cofactor guanylyltransferase [Candidatus Cloacimonetes bacterium]|nr:molybdenum cofactor guanylyltransferase [Candidatus Cloacimonadota bacterium]